LFFRLKNRKKAKCSLLVLQNFFPKNLMCAAHFEQQHTLSLLTDIQTADRQIDDMVFDLYGLTPEERALVRG